MMTIGAKNLTPKFSNASLQPWEGHDPHSQKMAFFPHIIAIISLTGENFDLLSSAKL